MTIWRYRGVKPYAPSIKRALIQPISQRATVCGFTIVSALRVLGTKPARQDRAIHGTQGQHLRQIPSRDVKLMTKEQDLSLQRGPRPEP